MTTGCGRGQLSYRMITGSISRSRSILAHATSIWDSSPTNWAGMQVSTSRKRIPTLHREAVSPVTSWLQISRAFPHLEFCVRITLLGTKARDRTRSRRELDSPGRSCQTPAARCLEPDMAFTILDPPVKPFTRMFLALRSPCFG